MGILISGIIYKGEILVEKKFYPEEGFIEEKVLGDLFSGVFDFVNQSFHDSLHKFAIGGYHVLIVPRKLTPVPEGEAYEPPLLIFSIIEQKTGEKPVLDAMNSALDQFLNRYSNFDIRSLKVKKFKKFGPRLEAIFSDLALKLEDRFKALY